MTSQEMMKNNCGFGSFENVSKLGEAPNWVIRNYAIESIEANRNEIFGYEEKEFLRRQYHGK